MNELRLGLVVAKRERPNLSELEKYLPNDWAEIFLFPESYLQSSDLDKVCEIVGRYKKWLITSMKDTREAGAKYQTGIVISPDGLVIGDHKKTSLTQPEIDGGTKPGTSIEAISTSFSKIGISVCYEIFFPEVSRIYALQGAKIIFNPIGSGMWHEQQYIQWSCIASARASENGVFVVGCSHHNDAIPMAYAYDPECLVQSREVNRMVRVIIDLDKSHETINLQHRRPHLYHEITK